MNRGRRIRRMAIRATPTKIQRQNVRRLFTESEFVEWVRSLASDPKWRNPTPWDEHTFRVGVMMELKRVMPRKEGV